MHLVDVLLTGVGLSMDAVAVGMTNGMNEKDLRPKKAFIIALFYGVAQGVMPLIGYLAGKAFSEFIASIAPYIALVLLGFIGGKMIFEAIKGEGEEYKPLSIKTLFVQTIATSIDALAVGISILAIEAAGDLWVNAYLCFGIIAAITFVLSFGAVYLGKKFGELLAGKAELVGGIILVLIGIKIFVEGVFF